MPKDIHYIPNFNEVAHIEREMVLRTLLSNYFRVVQVINHRRAPAQTSGPLALAGRQAWELDIDRPTRVTSQACSLHHDLDFASVVIKT